MPSLWFIVPVHGRFSLSAICLRQLRRTCDSLCENGVDATAVVIGDDANLDVARDLGFGIVKTGNEFVSQKYNHGIQLACDPELTPKPVNLYRVLGRRDYRGHEPGTEFPALLQPRAEYRAIERGSIERVGVVELKPEHYIRPDAPLADYVVPCGSDDWVDYELFTELPPSDTIYGFQKLSFVREDGLEMVRRQVKVPGGCGIRIYPREVLAALAFRPADEDRKRACDTSIITNLGKATPGRLRVEHRETDYMQIVDWKSPDLQLNPYGSLTFHKTFENPQNPFEALVGRFPDQALAEMAAHYGVRQTATI
jgi:hypothetical protein